MTTTEYWDLRLYVAGHTEKSVRAINNLKRICIEHLDGSERRPFGTPPVERGGERAEDAGHAARFR